MMENSKVPRDLAFRVARMATFLEIVVSRGTITMKQESTNRRRTSDNAIHGNVNEWWYDTCATIHVTYDRTIFKAFESSKEGHEKQMGSEKRSKAEGKGTIDLFFTSSKKVLLTNVLYVLEMSRNLVNGNLLGKPGIKVVIYSGKLI